jgi:hypothetical protein
LKKNCSFWICKGVLKEIKNHVNSSSSNDILYQTVEYFNPKKKEDSQNYFSNEENDSGIVIKEG